MVAHLLTASRAPGSALDTGAEDAADCVGLFRRSFIMVKQVKVSNFTEVKGIVSAAAKCYNDVGVHDMKGSIADAKSGIRCRKKASPAGEGKERITPLRKIF